MPKPRHTLIDPSTTPYYHCVSRCVRRAFLCGEDNLSGRSFEHRRGWIEERLLQLAEHFSVGVCAYAVMSNHTHVVLFIDREAANSWSTAEVIERWHGLFAGTLLSQSFMRGDVLQKAERLQLEAQAKIWRERLQSVSWFMRCLNEHIARLANVEDGCTGRFWEGRFKSQALLDEAALAACLAYVDLNPVRARLANTPETSDFTSVQRRIRCLSEAKGTQQPRALMPFVGNPRKNMPRGLPFNLQDYLHLVDWTGRALREDKRGAIPAHLPPILERLQIERRAWMNLTQNFEEKFTCLAGRIERVEQACEKLGLQWTRGAGNCRRLFSG
jgi:REP element-mobilizing transposase RayT